MVAGWLGFSSSPPSSSLCRFIPYRPLLFTVPLPIAIFGSSPPSIVPSSLPTLVPPRRRLRGRAAGTTCSTHRRVDQQQRQRPRPVDCSRQISTRHSYAVTLHRGIAPKMSQQRHLHNAGARRPWVLGKNKNKTKKQPGTVVSIGAGVHDAETNDSSLSTTSHLVSQPLRWARGPRPLRSRTAACTTTSRG